MIRKLCILGFGLIALTPSFAMHAAQAAAKQIVTLQTGETLYIFKNGLMAKEDKYGRAIHIRKGEVVETLDGERITTNGNEVALLSSLLNEGHGR